MSFSSIVSGQKGPRWGALALIVTAQFMVVLDVAIVNVALPSIKSDLHFSQGSLQWVITAYAIFFGGTLLLGNRREDAINRFAQSDRAFPDFRRLRWMEERLVQENGRLVLVYDIGVDGPGD